MTSTLSTGFSKAAETITGVCREQSRQQRVTVTFSDFPLHDQLIDVFNECSVAGWEGEHSEPVKPETLVLAMQIVESLPKAYRTPTIAGEPDGHVSLEWYMSPRRILNVSINPNGTLHWAALIGDEDPRGSCHFFGETPATLLYWIGRVCSK